MLAEIRRLCALTLEGLHAMRLRLKLKKMLNWASELTQAGVTRISWLLLKLKSGFVSEMVS